MARLPISPESIFINDEGRCFYYDEDVTDTLFWWQCPECDNPYQETLANMLADCEVHMVQRPCGHSRATA